MIDSKTFNFVVVEMSTLVDVMVIVIRNIMVEIGFNLR